MPDVLTGEELAAIREDVASSNPDAKGLRLEQARALLAHIAALRESLAWALAFAPTRTKRNNADFQEKKRTARALLGPGAGEEA